MDIRHSYVYFALMGDVFDMENVTSKLEIVPTEVWKKGDAGRYRKELDFSCWKLCSKKNIDQLFVADLVNEVVGQLFDKIDAINELKQQYGLQSILEVVLYVNTNEDESTPSLGFDSKTIEFLYRTNTEVDVDIYRRI